MLRFSFAYLTLMALYVGWNAARLKEEAARISYHRCRVIFPVCFAGSLLATVAGELWTMSGPVLCAAAVFPVCGLVLSLNGLVYGSVLVFRPALRGIGIRWLGISIVFILALNFAAWLIQTDPFEIPGG